ncbi:MAG: hypothetical protein ACE5I9_02220 [Candidatus Methylomirabilales bacterium]
MNHDLACQDLFIAFRNLPEERRERLVTSYSKLIRIYKIALWFIPINGTILLFAGFTMQDRNLLFLGITSSLCFMVVLEDYLFRKAIVRKMTERHHVA